MRVLIIAILLATTVIAQPYAKDSLTIDTITTGNITIQELGRERALDYIIAELAFFPKNRNWQNILTQRTTPKADQTNGQLRFRFEEPVEGTLAYRVDSRVQTNSGKIVVTQRTEFPYREIEAEAQPYLQPTQKIDADSRKVRELAAELAGDEADAFVVVSRIASWVRGNVEYNLSTLTAEAVQSASWVLDNRQGVCDELTGLFIAMLRSIGIPARFVSGLAYTEDPSFPDRWGAHGWAEVWFPEAGWMPFDVTYGQYGWVDATHIVMRESLDATAPSANFRWPLREATIDASPLAFEADVVNEGRMTAPDVELSLSASHQKVGFGSYAMLTATATNLRDHYVATELTLAESDVASMEDNKRKLVVIPPRGSGKAQWMVRIDDDLKREFEYTIPFAIIATKNETAETRIQANARDNKISRTAIEALRITQPAKEPFPATVTCSAEPPEFYPDETSVLTCSFTNKQEVTIRADACLADNCQGAMLPPRTPVTRTWTLPKTMPGTRDAAITTLSQGKRTIVHTLVTQKDYPSISITEMQAPASTTYDGRFTIEVTISRESTTTPQNVVLQLNGRKAMQTWTVDELEAEQAYELSAPGAILSSGENTINATVYWTDERGRDYTTSKTITISLVELAWWQRAMLWLRDLLA